MKSSDDRSAAKISSEKRGGEKWKMKRHGVAFATIGAAAVKLIEPDKNTDDDVG